MFSKLRYFTQPHTARSSLSSTRFILDKTVTELRDIKHVTQTSWFCDKLYCENEATHTEPNGAYMYLKCQSEDEASACGTSGDRLSCENDNVYKEPNIRQDIDVVSCSQIGHGSLDQRKLGTTKGVGRLFGKPGFLENKQIHNVVQNSFLSTTSARTFSSQTTSLKPDTEKSMGWLAGLRHLMYGEEKSIVEKSPEDLPEGSLWPLMRGCDTVEEVLNLMEPKIDRQELDIDQYGEILQKLQMIIYKNLNQRYAWIHDEVIPSIYVILLLNDTRVSEFEYLGKVSSFQKLQENIVRLLHKMTVDQFVACLSGFVWLGVPATSSTIVTFMSKLEDFPFEDYTILSLHILSVCILSFGRPDILVARQIHPKLKALIEDGREIGNDKKTLFSLFFLGHLRIADVDIGIWLTQQILKIVEETDHLKDPFLAAMCMKLCKDTKYLATKFHPGSFYDTYDASVSEKVSAKLEDLDSYIQTLIDIVIINLMDAHDRLSCTDIGRAASNAHSLGIYDMPWADVLKKRSCDIIFDETVPTAQRVHALEGLVGCDNLDIETREKIDNFILTSIDSTDPLTTTFILRYISCQEINNTEVLTVCEKKIAEDFEKMVGFRILSKRMFSYLANCPMQDEKVHVYLQTKLLGTENISLSYNHDLILSYLICQKSWVSTSPALLTKVSEHLGWCSFRDFSKLLAIASSDFSWRMFKRNLMNNDSMNEETSQAIGTFEMYIGKRFFKAIEANDNLRFVLHYTNKVANINNRIVCFKTVMRAVEKSFDTASLDGKSFRRFMLISNFWRGTVSPKMFDKFLDAFDTQIDELSVKKYVCDIMLENIADWFCSESNEITTPFKGKIQDILQTKLDILVKDRDPVRTVKNMFRLCCLGIFPETALVDLLNVDALAKLDEVIQEAEQNRVLKRNVYDMIAMINRCVVLEKPDLQIPWFMGSHAEDGVEYKRSMPAAIARKERLYRLMCNVLGVGYFGHQTILDYGYCGDFVCLINKENEVIPYSEKNYTFARELELQRTLVDFSDIDLVRRPNAVFTKMRHMHLQKLGYRVVAIHDWEYYSLALALYNDRMVYMRNKILGVHHLPPPEYRRKEKEVETTQIAAQAAKMVG